MAVTDDVDWASEAARKRGALARVRRGKEAFAAFFAAHGSAMEVE